MRMLSGLGAPITTHRKTIATQRSKVIQKTTPASMIQPAPNSTVGSPKKTKDCPISQTKRLEMDARSAPFLVRLPQDDGSDKSLRMWLEIGSHEAIFSDGHNGTCRISLTVLPPSELVNSSTTATISQMLTTTTTADIATSATLPPTTTKGPTAEWRNLTKDQKAVLIRCGSLSWDLEADKCLRLTDQTDW